MSHVTHAVDVYDVYFKGVVSLSCQMSIWIVACYVTNDCYLMKTLYLIKFQLFNLRKRPVFCFAAMHFSENLMAFLMFKVLRSRKFFSSQKFKINEFGATWFLPDSAAMLWWPRGSEEAIHLIFGSEVCTDSKRQGPNWRVITLMHNIGVYFYLSGMKLFVCSSVSLGHIHILGKNKTMLFCFVEHAPVWVHGKSSLKFDFKWNCLESPSYFLSKLCKESALTINRLHREQ